MIQITLDIITKDSTMTRHIITELKKHAESTVLKAMPRIKDELRDSLSKRITGEPEYASLLQAGGYLQELFGLQTTPIKVDDTVKKLVDSLEIKKRHFANSNASIIRGGLFITAIPSNHKDIINTPEAKSFITKQLAIFPPTYEPLVINWIDWLLTEGNSIMFSNYDIYVDSRRGTVYVESPGASIRIPSQFTGTIGSNWITRAMDGLDKEIHSIIEKYIKVYW